MQAEPVNRGTLDNGNPTILRLYYLDARRYAVSDLRLEMLTLPKTADEHDCRNAVTCHGYLLPHETNNIFHDRVEDACRHLFLCNGKAAALQTQAFIDSHR